MKGYQPQLFQLRSPTVAAGQSDTVTLDTLPGLMLDGIAHVLGFLFRARITPTFTTAPTVYGVNNLVARLTVNNGMNVMFDGSFNSLRFHEILENGGTPLLPDPDTNSGTGNGFYFERVMWLGPNRYAGAPSDFAMPCAAMRNGSIQFNFGSVTQISADTSAYTSSIEVYAILAPIYGEVRVPALWERNSYSFGAAEYSIQGRAKYGNVAIQAGSLTTVTTLAAGNLVALTIDTGKGSLSAVSSQALSSLRNVTSSSVGTFSLGSAGEPSAATDDNPKQVNLGTPTALQAADRVIQPVVMSQDDQYITKLSTEAQSSLRIRWTGNLASGLIHCGRIIPATDTVQAAIAAKALSELRLPFKSIKVKTLSKQEYTGAAKDFLPAAAKVG